MNIHVTDQQGVERSLRADGNGTLMSLIRDAGMSIRAECGGCCVCATCHVRVDEAWADALPPMSEEESFTLEGACEPGISSRLSCQIPLASVPDGLRVTLAQDWS
ncbi:2Fe-2S iron-sulfur cluster-binding protein [Variovorax sp. PBL-E5]|uniref:2Fe-2S iron-sulfur cluster-binding protein n=1 Tax=Variovorax sp. PBL-E5 TaxID=434014 RepID=UPI001318368F|nr:2Fe-2S iron-sulfur cluster-binding protein [Variovorax sp. PBL-E5]VTU30425.1 Ferredoxin VI [Variovorax sp. PBL-E5]